MRYIIGIDLGTTNSSVAYVDSQGQYEAMQQFRIPQLVAAGYSENLNTLPSFCYLCFQNEWPKGSLALPWKEKNDFFVGRFAQIHGSKVPTRLVQSAKSWLCHAAANRREKILPLEAAEEVRISPIEASARYLAHIKEAWNALIAKGDVTQEFEQQEIVLTVPASFDEVARRLTVEAASQAGLKNLTLLEEPQAAFYSWLAQHENSWQERLPLGSTVLVCDIGGGTTDFSLIEVKGTTAAPLLQRMAVGNHLLLGGDNIDEALAYYLEAKLAVTDLSNTEWMQLKAQAREAKEALLNASRDSDSFQVTLQGSGSSIIGSTKTTAISYEEILKLLSEGFFGQYAWEEALSIIKSSAIKSMGLPYESEPSITKHLANFLQMSAPKASEIKSPDFILFNGGTMKPKLFQEAMIKSLERWFPQKKVTALPSYHLDLAVARGAAYYGKVRRGLGVKIGGGTARGYYLGVETKSSSGELTSQAMTLLPRGTEEGTSYEPDKQFLLRPNTPVSFQLYTSHVRLHDHSGDLINIDPEQLQPLPPIHTIIRYGKKKPLGESELIPVHVAVHLNAIGILEIVLKSLKSDHTWTLEFQLKSAAGQDNSLLSLDKGRQDEIHDQTFLEEPKKLIEKAFCKGECKPEKLMDLLESQLNQPRKEWPPSVLRGLADKILQVADQRKKTAPHEMRWWNLMGFFLLPGTGYPLDDFRVKELWKIILSESRLATASDIQVQKWICYRRISAGLNKGQQAQLTHEILPLVLNKRGKIELKGKSEFSQYAEKIRALASLELMDVSLKIKLGEALLTRIVQGEAISVDYWALGRIGARHLLYGSHANVIDKDICMRWLKALLSLPIKNSKEYAFLIAQLARKTDSREINIPISFVEEILKELASRPELEAEMPQLQKALLELNVFSAQDQERIFGEHLPLGLLHVS